MKKAMNFTYIKKKLINSQMSGKKYKREKIDIESQQHDRLVWNEVDKVDNIVRHNTNEHNGSSIIN